MWVPVAAVGDNTNVILICVELTTAKFAMEAPLPPKRALVDGVKLVPVRTTLTEVPRAPLLGFIAVRVGAEGTGFTVNGNVLLLPAAVFTATV